MRRRLFPAWLIAEPPEQVSVLSCAAKPRPPGMMCLMRGCDDTRLSVRLWRLCRLRVYAAEKGLKHHKRP